MFFSSFSTVTLIGVAPPLFLWNYFSNVCYDIQENLISILIHFCSIAQASKKHQHFLLEKPIYNGFFQFFRIFSGLKLFKHFSFFGFKVFQAIIKHFKCAGQLLRAVHDFFTLYGHTFKQVLPVTCLHSSSQEPWRMLHTVLPSIP